MNFLLIESLYPEEENFTLHRDNIGQQYIFLHFLTPVTAILKGHEVDITPGGCVFFGMNSMQHFSSRICGLLHDWFHADSGCVELLKKYGIECETVYYPEDSGEITRIISEIQMEYTHKGRHYREAADALAEHMFIKLARSKDNDKQMPSSCFVYKDRFIEARALIHMDLRRQWHVREMAELVNLSPSRFYYIYKNIFKISPQQDLINKRIKTAQVLLMENKLSVEETARLTGYTNQYHFIRQFKQITGTTPGKMRSEKI